MEEHESSVRDSKPKDPADLRHQHRRRLATWKLKWGVVSAMGTDSKPDSVAPGHLAFGSEEQDVGEVVEGEIYTGNQS